jgi:hypothetical protein
MLTRLSFAALLVAFLAGASAVSACSSQSSLPGGDGGTKDVSAPHDGGAHDASKDAGVGILCGKLLTCDQVCKSSACTDACYAEATGHAQGIFNAFNACLDAHCPSTDGGACANSGSSACSNCDTSAATGACISLLLVCEGDKQMGPPDPDGGSAEYDAGPMMDSGPRTSCGDLVGCQNACKDGDSACKKACFNQGTSAAQALDEALDNCVLTACPTTDGGPCAVASTTCTGCESEADFGTCGSQFSACQDDKSGSSDAGTDPVALHGGTVNLLLSGLDQPQVVIVQGGLLYSSEVASPGPVLDLPIAGGAATTLAASEPFPMGLALDTNNIYVWNSGSFPSGGTLNNGDGTVVQIALAGGATTTLATKMTVAFTAPYLNAITNDSANVYWVTGGPGVPGAINVAPIGGATAAAVLYGSQSYPQAVITDGTNLYWGNWGTFDSKGNYNNDGAILKAVASGGSTPVTLASKLSAPAAIALDGQNVYWTNIGKLTPAGLPAPGTGSVMQVAISGGPPTTLASKQNIPLGIAVSGDTVYWTEYTLSAPGSIDSAPVGGGVVTTLVGNVKDPFGLTVSGGTIFWSDNIPTGVHTGALYSLTP